MGQWDNRLKAQSDNRTTGPWDKGQQDKDNTGEWDNKTTGSIEGDNETMGQ